MRWWSTHRGWPAGRYPVATQQGAYESEFTRNGQLITLTGSEPHRTCLPLRAAHPSSRLPDSTSVFSPPYSWSGTGSWSMSPDGQRLVTLSDAVC